MAALSDPRQKNSNILRLIAASAVIFSHAADIGTGEHDVIYQWIGISGGSIAVCAFFSISGMLIYRSIIHSGSLRIYVIARSLRIFPGLWVMLLLTTLLLGPLVTELPAPDYFGHPQTPEYFYGNAVLYLPQYLLPEVFEGNPVAAVNAPLWTLRFEFTCYILTLVMFLVGAYPTETRFRAMTAVYLLGYVGLLPLFARQGSVVTQLPDGGDLAKRHGLTKRGTA